MNETTVLPTAEMREGARLMNHMPYIEAEISAGMRAVENSVLGLINSGDLTPERAQQKWIEWSTYKRMSQKMNQKVNVMLDKVQNTR